MPGEMSNWGLHKYHKWVWLWPWTFKFFFSITRYSRYFGWNLWASTVLYKI